MNMAKYTTKTIRDERGNTYVRSTGALHVQVWYDRRARHWVTQYVDAVGCQLWDKGSDFSYTKAGAMLSASEYLMGQQS
jgi:hypothetical protein